MAADNYQEYLVQVIKETLAKYPRVVHEKLQDCPITGPGGVRRALGEIDLEFFSRAYFPQYFKKEIPEFHKQAYSELNALLNDVPSYARKVRAWPRGNAKSTIYNFFTPTHAAIYGKRAFVVQVSDTESQAQGFLGDIKNAVEHNEYIIEDFGDIQGTTWRVDMVEILNTLGGSSWIAAVGAGSGIRGLRKGAHRPDLIVADDLESDASVLTPDRINKLYQWFTRALLNLGDDRTDVIVVGTVLAYDSVLDKLLKSPAWDAKKLVAVVEWSTSELWDVWRKIYTDLSIEQKERLSRSNEFYAEHEKEMLAGAEVLWPDYWPYLRLMQIYTDIGDAAFYAEQQNDPINLEDCPIRPEWLQYYSEEELRSAGIVEYYGALDPSLGKSRLSDFSAVIVLGKGTNGLIYVVDCVVERLNPDRILEVLLQKGREYNFVRFGVEVNQWQDLLRMMLVARSAKEGLYLPIVELRHTKDKVIRVQSLIPYIKNGYIKFNREHRLLLEQLKGFPKLRHDDGPDCLEMAVRMVSQGPAIDAMMTGTATRTTRQAVNDDDDDDADNAFNTRSFYG